METACCKEKASSEIRMLSAHSSTTGSYSILNMTGLNILPVKQTLILVNGLTNFCTQRTSNDKDTNDIAINGWSQNSNCTRTSLQARNTHTNSVLSYTMITTLLLLLSTNVSLSATHQDLCDNITWTSSINCSCNAYAWNTSTCKNISSFDEFRYTCNCGSEIVCTISSVNSSDVQDLSGNCSCIHGQIGQKCESANNCTECQNGATCISNFSDSNYSYSCVCPTGYEGLNCEKNINECKENGTSTCKNNATCVDGIANFTCNCTEGYEGLDCGIANCSRILCQNGGICKTDSKGKWLCNCTDYYKGEFCQYDINECNVSDVCKNNGTCVNSNEGYNCTCLSGYWGKFCENDINECNVSDVCKNNSTCVNFDGGYNCTCLSGYSGANCSDFDSCFSSPCRNGNCTNHYNSYTCQCFPGFLDDQCELMDPCYENPCKEGGECIRKTNFSVSRLQTNLSFSCSCYANYTGSHCETLITSDNFEPTSSPPVGLIVGLTVGLFVLLLIILGIVLLVIILNKRKNLGTYHPSEQEAANARLEVNGGLKPPPEERLI